MLTLNQTVDFGTPNVLPLPVIYAILISLFVMTCLVALTFIFLHSEMQ